ncbi:MAG: YdcF family protein [Ilumatobacter sp.]|nr:YdcF family protein [Ilumatobacter sp.]
MPDEFPLDRALGDDAADRHAADDLRRDYSPRGEVRIGSALVAPLRVFFVVVGVVLLYYVVNLAQVVHTGGSHGAEPSDAIMVLGAAQYDGRPSPQLAGRLDHAAALYTEGVAPTIVVTGGNIPGDRFTEAEASASYLIDRGIPAEVIVQVGEGNTTYDSVAAAVPVLDTLGIDQVALVTDPYHALRARLIAEELGLSVDVASVPDSVVQGGTAWKRNLEEAAGVSLGRLVGWERFSELTN